MPSRVQPQMGGVNEQSSQPQGPQRKAPQGAQPSTGPFPPGPSAPPPAQPQGPFNPLPSPGGQMVSQAAKEYGGMGNAPGVAGGQDIMSMIMQMLGKGGSGGGPTGY